MRRKEATITVELVDESVREPNEKIAQELIEWFGEHVIFIPWAKGVKDITVKDR